MIGKIDASKLLTTSNPNSSSTTVEGTDVKLYEYPSVSFLEDSTEENSSNIEKTVMTPQIESILESNPDFLAQHFSAYLLWYTNEASSPENLFNSHIEDTSGKFTYSNDYQKAILSKEGFGVRFCEISIPNVKNEDFDLPIGQISIKKIKSSKSMNKKVQFSFRLDDNLEWLNFFNKLSGQNNSISNDTALTDWRKNVTYVTKSFTSLNENKMKLCLLVKPQALDEFSFFDKDTENFLWLYLFEDIKFIGAGDSISYDSTSPGEQNANTEFIFKRLRRINMNSGISVKEKNV